MSDKIIVVGAGPRGLAIALQASLNNIPTVIIDDQPNFSWTSPNIIPDIIMRSPITFDLTTYIPELQQYSLANFLGIDCKFSTKQKDIESNNIRPTREQFISYLNYIYSLLKHNSNINFIKSKVKSIGADYVEVEVEEGIYYSKHIVLAIGSSFSKVKVPYWIDLSKFKDKIVSLKDIVKSEQVSAGKFAVVGSGQGAAETVYHLAKQSNKVFWLLNKPLKTSQYPVPDYTIWYNKSALGEYYKMISTLERKEQYLREVKSWQPSITPYIKKQLELHEDNIEILTPSSTLEIEYIFNNINFIIVSTGFNLNVNNLPFNFKEFSLELDNINSNFPKLVKGFKSSNVSSLYFTGALASMYDGPRQNSLISSAITAKEIIENIKLN